MIFLQEKIKNIDRNRSKMNLSWADIKKYSWRLELILNRIKNKEPFYLNSNKQEVILKLDETQIALLKEVPDKLPNKFIFDSSKGKLTFGKLFKDAVIAGRTQNTLRDENIALNSIKQQIIKAKGNNAFIKIKANNKIHKVVDVISTPKTPKSDFHCIDFDGEECIFMSHKKGSTAKDFQQWSGVFAFRNHKEIKNFLDDLKKRYPDGGIPKLVHFRKISDENLKKKAVYGDNFKPSGKTNIDNIDLVLQGDLKLIEKNNYYIIASNHTLNHGNKILNDYEPTLFATFRTGKGGSLGLKNIRVGIYPKVFKKGKEI
jgi:hypothetical protein